MSNDQNESAGIRDATFPNVGSSPSAAPKRDAEVALGRSAARHEAIAHRIEKVLHAR